VIRIVGTVVGVGEPSGAGSAALPHADKTTAPINGNSRRVGIRNF
jgi:hypothetical protein